MIRKLSERFVSWQAARGILAEEETSVYQYAYEILINQIINVLIAILIAVIWQSPIPVFVFLASYIPLRSYCGGYHAKTNGGCTVVSAILICVVCGAVKLVPLELVWTVQLASVAVLGFFVLLYAPVEDSNKPLDELESVRYRKFSVGIWLVEVGAGVVFTYVFKIWQVGFTVAVSHLILALMLCLGIYKNKRLQTSQPQ